MTAADAARAGPMSRAIANSHRHLLNTSAEHAAVLFRRPRDFTSDQEIFTLMTVFISSFLFGSCASAVVE